MTEFEQRAAVIAEAMTWLGTPFHLNTAIKGVGVDCGRLVLEVYRACGIMGALEIGQWAGDWFLHCHPGEDRYLDLVSGALRQVERPQPGDMALFRMGRAYAHSALVVDWPRIIHVERPGSRVALSNARMEPRMRTQAGRFFSPWRSIMSTEPQA